MSDGRLSVVTAGNVYPSIHGVRILLEGSGYRVAAHVATPQDLVAAVARVKPDAVLVGDELAPSEVIPAIRRTSADTRIVLVSASPAPAPDDPARADAYVARGAPLATITAALADLLVEPSTTPAALARMPEPPSRARSGARVLQLLAAATLALSLGGLVLFFSGGTRPVGEIRTAPGTGIPSAGPGTPSTGSPAPGRSPLERAEDQLTLMVSAIQGQRYDAAVSLARGLVADRQEAVGSGMSVEDLDAHVTTALRPLMAQIPAEVVPALRSVLDGLVPSVGPQIQLVGSGTFGDVQIGSASSPRTVLVESAGGQVLQLSAVQIAGSGAPHFSQTNDCAGAELSPGTSCSVQIAFAPSTAGAKTAELVVQAEGLTSAATMGLTGNGTIAAPPDTEAPVLLCAQPAPTWFGTDVVVACTARDDGSGLASSTDASFTLSTHVPAGVEDADASTTARTVCDADGNCAQAGPIGGIRVDKRAPHVLCARPDRSWHRDNETVRCRARDHGSGLSSSSSAVFGLSTTVPRGVESDHATTGARRVCDAVGNCTTAGPVQGLKVDRKAPQTSCARPDRRWHRLDVTVSCRARDGGSGLRPRGHRSFALSTNVPAGTADAHARTNTRRVCDAVGNCTTAGPVTGFKVDKAAPRIVLTGFADGSTLLLNQSTSSTVSVTCSDQGSGVATCSAPRSIQTDVVGTFTVTATATDRVGNRSTATVRYRVTYGVALLYDPSKPTRKISIRLVDADGRNVSSRFIAVRAVDIDGVALHKPFVYRRSSSSYRFTIPGRKDAAPHVLHFVAEDDPVVHAATFVMGRGDD